MLGGDVGLLMYVDGRFFFEFWDYFKLLGGDWILLFWIILKRVDFILFDESSLRGEGEFWNELLVGVLNIDLGDWFWCRLLYWLSFEWSLWICNLDSL